MKERGGATGAIIGIIASFIVIGFGAMIILNNYTNSNGQNEIPGVLAFAVIFGGLIGFISGTALFYEATTEKFENNNKQAGLK